MSDGAETRKAAAAVREQALQMMREYRMLAPGEAVLVAVSGGADSLCLLHLLQSLRETLGLREVSAMHIHHGLRGAEADRDETHVRELCRAWDVPLIVRRADVAGEAAKSREGLEEAGRRVRYAFLEEQAALSAFPCKIATAHTLSDAAETVLLHLTRGCGLSGLAGIPPVRGRIIRPLLSCTRMEIEAYCEVHALSYVEDSTNTDITFTRNRLRHQVLPELRRLNPQIEQSLSRMMRLVSQDEAYLREQAQGALIAARLPDTQLPTYDASALEVLPPAIRSRTLWQAAVDAGADPEARHVETLQALLRAGGACHLPGGVEARVNRGRLTFMRTAEQGAGEPFCIPIEPGGTYTFGDTRYHCRLLSAADFAEARKIYKNLLHFSLCYDILSGNLIARQKLPGDRYHPVNRGGKTLKALYQEAGLTVRQRETLPVLCDEQGIVFVPGFGCDERVKLTDTCEQVLLFFSDFDGDGRAE